jgi:hypothetical protein
VADIEDDIDAVNGDLTDLRRAEERAAFVANLPETDR